MHAIKILIKASFKAMIKIICEGKIREDFIKRGIEEYIKRIRKFVKIEILQENIMEDCDYKIFLDEKGKEMDSIEFANFLKNLLMEYKKICFFIGDWKGIEKEKFLQADFILSLSKFTFPYQFCPLILLEQIYRAITIIKGISYHK